MSVSAWNDSTSVLAIGVIFILLGAAAAFGAKNSDTPVDHVAGNAVSSECTRSRDVWSVDGHAQPHPLENQPPLISLTVPNGTQDWTGGTPHLVTWTMNDDSTPPSNLIVYINFSSFLGQGIIGWHLVGRTSWTWNVPAMLDSPSMRVNATVIDDGGLNGFSEVMVPRIDSTPPDNFPFSPVDGATGIPLDYNVFVQWSEPMNKTSTEAAFRLKNDVTLTEVAGVMSWVGNRMTFHQSTLLAPNTKYRVNIASGAKDISDPGNAFVGTGSWAFTTADVDLTRPTISSVTAIPNPQESGHGVNVSALVQDERGVGIVSLRVTPPGQSATNVSMNLDCVSGRYYLNSTYSVLGTHIFVVWASDYSGNWNSSSGQFAVSDFTSPAAPVRLTVQVLSTDTLELTWAANTEPDLAGYRVYRSLRTGGPYTLVNTANLVTLTVYGDAGLEGGRTYYYMITAVDNSGNESPGSNEASGTLQTSGGGVLSATDWLIIMILMVVIVVVVFLALLLMRRGKNVRRRNPEPPSRDKTG